MKYLQLILVALLFLSCKKEEVQHVERPIKTDSIAKNVEAKIAEVHQTKYSISVENVDSVSFYKMKSNVVKIREPEKITDFKTAQRLLKGIVEFESVDQNSNYQAVTKINFKNGTKLENRNDFDGETFVAYFPTEDILLCEGGHTSDVSFNLKNGNRTEETGNPDVISASTKNKFRLNGYFGGQECYSYFLQKNINGEFRKIIQLDEEFEKITKHWLCTISDTFWTDDRTLYLIETNLGDKSSRFFKVVING